MRGQHFIVGLVDRSASIAFGLEKAFGLQTRTGAVAEVVFAVVEAVAADVVDNRIGWGLPGLAVHEDLATIAAADDLPGLALAGDVEGPPAATEPFVAFWRRRWHAGCG